jgi:hypothetical protein
MSRRDQMRLMADVSPETAKFAQTGARASTPIVAPREPFAASLAAWAEPTFSLSLAHALWLSSCQDKLTEFVGRRHGHG